MIKDHKNHMHTITYKLKLSQVNKQVYKLQTSTAIIDFTGATTCPPMHWPLFLAPQLLLPMHCFFFGGATILDTRSLHYWSSLLLSLRKWWKWAKWEPKCWQCLCQVLAHVLQLGCAWLYLLDSAYHCMGKATSLPFFCPVQDTAIFHLCTWLASGKTAHWHSTLVLCLVYHALLLGVLACILKDRLVKCCGMSGFGHCLSGLPWTWFKMLKIQIQLDIWWCHHFCQSWTCHTRDVVPAQSVLDSSVFYLLCASCPRPCLEGKTGSLGDFVWWALDPSRRSVLSR